jgi:CheY-like chemotaxis protein
MRTRGRQQKMIQSVPKKILVIEDEPAIRDMCQTALNDEGYQTEVVENGSVALETLGKTEYDLYLLDIRMPLMNGIDFFEQLETEFPELVKKIVFTTGDLMSRDVTAFLEKSNRPLLPKPFGINDLKSIVRRSLGLDIL